MTFLSNTVIVLMTLEMAKSAKVNSYKEHKLEDLCGASKEKKSLYLDNQAHLFTFNSSNKELLKCHLELHLHSETFGFSIFTEAMKLEDTKGCTRDFLQFGRLVIFWSFILVMASCISEILLSSLHTKAIKDVEQ